MPHEDEDKQSKASPFSEGLTIFGASVLSAFAGMMAVSMANPYRGPNPFRGVGILFTGLISGALVFVTLPLLLFIFKPRALRGSALLFLPPVLVFISMGVYNYIDGRSFREYSDNLAAARQIVHQGPGGLETLAREIMEGRANKETLIVFDENMINTSAMLSESTSHAFFEFEKKRGFQTCSFIRRQPLTQEMLRQVALHSPPNTLALLNLLDRKDLPRDLIEILTHCGVPQVESTAKFRLAERTK